MKTKALFLWFLFGKFLSSQALRRTNMYYCPSTWNLNLIEEQFIVRVPRVISDAEPFQWWGVCKDAENDYKKKIRRGVGSQQEEKERCWSRHGGRQKLREECVATRGTQCIEVKSQVFLQVNWSFHLGKKLYSMRGTMGWGGFRDGSSWSEGRDPKTASGFVGIHRAPKENLRVTEKLGSPNRLYGNSTKRSNIEGDLHLLYADWNGNTECVQTFINRVV
jgi:hypothetical protein